MKELIEVEISRLSKRFDKMTKMRIDRYLRLKELNAPQTILKNEARMVYECEERKDYCLPLWAKKYEDCETTRDLTRCIKEENYWFEKMHLPEEERHYISKRFVYKEDNIEETFTIKSQVTKPYVLNDKQLKTYHTEEMIDKIRTECDDDTTFWDCRDKENIPLFINCSELKNLDSVTMIQLTDEEKFAKGVFGEDAIEYYKPPEEFNIGKKVCIRIEGKFETATVIATEEGVYVLEFEDKSIKKVPIEPECTLNYSGYFFE